MANFDDSKWYQISTPGDVLSFVGTPANTKDNTTSVQPYGPVFLRISNSTDREQQWQIYNVNSTTVVMRTRASGPDNYLSAAVAQDDDGEVNAGSTKPIMGNYSLLDSSMFWHIGAWSDGLFWLENAQNGSAWHLNHTGNGYFRMSSNITAPQTGQRFKFTALEDINNDKYSTYSAPGIAAAATATASSSATATANTSSTSKRQKTDGLTAGGKGAVGAAAGGVFLLILGLVLLWRLKKRKKQLASDAALEPPRTELAQEAQISELPATEKTVPELPGTAASKFYDEKRSELPVDTAPSELGGNHISELPEDSRK
ncbi:hypothetical protein BFW01_g10282 [Lasiodiplodia theobromae]|uniref:Uncharacterized protein n=1 Tax=Lasiodiplodia theobromae TaxID=45133 RepID=A0A5N5D5P5_9PEZI|nr:hypothetical protein DBV05_g8637 [Lasiodiplodia theobromae]KAF9629079.1 hypothetical protein BFW01_g10282 [Lasiodiplodia theobromae]